MWFNLDNVDFDLREVSSVHLLEKNGGKQLVIVMKNQKEIKGNITNDNTSDSVYDSITSLLHALRERDMRTEKNTFELRSRILSELKLISQNLRRL